MKQNNKQPTIGYLNTSLIHDWAELPWQGATTAAAKHNVNLFSFLGGNMNDINISRQQRNSVYNLANRDSIDGMIIWNAHLTQYLDELQIKSFLKKINLPTIILEHTIPGYNTISYGNYEGIQMLMDHLVQIHGYKKIGFMGEDNNHYGFKTRRLSYLDGLKAYGLDFDPRFTGPWVEWIHEYNGRSSDEILDEWLLRALDLGMEAIICMADPIAWWVMERLVILGFNVPEDLAVLGFDAFHESKVNNPPITTVDPDYFGLGTLAVESLLDLINGKSLPEKIMVPPKLFIGRSCGCIDANVIKAATILGTQHSNQNLLILELASILPFEKEKDLQFLYHIFINNLNGNSRVSFINTLEKAIYRNIAQGETLMPWQDAITVLNNIPSKKRLLRENLCHQARILVSNASIRQEGWKRYQAIEKVFLEREISSSMLSNFELTQVLNLLEINIKNMGINQCILTLFEKSFTYHFPEKLPEKCRLVLAYTESGRSDLGPEGIFINTYEILHKAISKSSKPSNWTIFTLYFRDQQIGLILFEINKHTGLTCEFLSVFLSSSLQSIMLINEKKAARKKMELIKIELQKELEVAKKIQRALLPENTNHDLFDIAAVMNTAIAVGGDYYDIFKIHDRDWFVVGDVSGHGVQAGLIMMMVQTSIHLLTKQFPDISPSRLLSLTNDVVRENIKKLEDDKYMTINILSHTQNGHFEYSGMHLPILIYRHRTKKVEQIEMKGIWLGVIDDISTMNKNEHFSLNHGDCLLLFTDGLTEAKTKSGCFYGIETLVGTLEQSGNKSSCEILTEIQAILYDDNIEDDMTILAIKYR
ncbi:MAG: SpoIIE family protein phosphatase [Spirochaetales bacterium]|nr:SpoIIE family protein phosphatase [Spirochaetales bacterium]